MPKTDVSPEPATEFALSGNYLFTAVSAWLLPGAGHWLLGFRVRAVILALPILGIFWLGQALAVAPEDPKVTNGSMKPIAVSRKVNPVFFACQVGNGFSTLLSELLWGKPRYKNDLEPIDRRLPRHLNLAILFTSISGLLNFLLVLHVLDPRSWIEAGAGALTEKDPKERRAGPPQGRT